MLSDPVRKLISECRCGVAKIIVDRTSPSDLNALCMLDGLLFNDGARFNNEKAKDEVGISFNDSPASSPNDLTVLNGEGDDPLDEVEKLKRQREQDSKLIEGLQREIAKLKQGRA
jgi:hypothetical protein